MVELRPRPIGRGQRSNDRNQPGRQQPNRATRRVRTRLASPVDRRAPVNRRAPVDRRAPVRRPAPVGRVPADKLVVRIKKSRRIFAASLETIRIRTTMACRSISGSIFCQPKTWRNFLARWTNSRLNFDWAHIGRWSSSIDQFELTRTTKECWSSVLATSELQKSQRHINTFTTLLCGLFWKHYFLNSI